jgi:putative ubiquitin-RnfH superfamily antitoxin RatB of RatAB toxin-antitoxin module
MRVEVAYATPREQVIVGLDVGEGATVEAAIRQSGLLSRFPEIDLAQNQAGVFGKPCGLSQLVREGDRVEIYRPLLADPKEARRHRAAKR